MLKFLNKIKNFLVNGQTIHLWQDNASSPGELIGLMDRFLDGNYIYPMEWDDFISWENDNANFEQIRQRIGMHEALLFSGEVGGMKQYKAYVLDERNRLAGIVGIPVRLMPGDGEDA